MRKILFLLLLYLIPSNSQSSEIKFEKISCSINRLTETKFMRTCAKTETLNNNTLNK